jgi:hypothetical protein
MMIVRILKSSLEWAGHAGKMGETSNAYRFWRRIFSETGHLED